MAHGTKIASNKKLVVVSSVFVVGLVVTVGSILLGRADVGQIDVSATINNSNRASVDSGDTSKEATQPVSDAFANMPNGGLVPQAPGSAPEPIPEPEVASTTATTSDTISNSETETSQDAAPAPAEDTGATQ